jgi:hypothetical protein
MSSTERELVAKAKQGDSAAIVELWAHYEEQVHALHRVGSR